MRTVSWNFRHIVNCDKIKAFSGANVIRPSTIRAYARRLAREFKPERVVLFGSYAYGNPTEDSDVDLLVVLPHRGSSADVAARIRARCAAPFPLDLVVRSPAALRRRLRMRDYFMREIVENGKLLYASGNT